MTTHETAKKIAMAMIKASPTCYFTAIIAGTLGKNGFIVAVNGINLLMGIANLLSILGAITFIVFMLSIITVVITTINNKLSQKHN